MTPADQLIQEVEHARATLIAAVSSLTERQGAFKPADNQWSVVEVLEHLYLAELSGVAKIWVALDLLRANEGWAEARPNRGKSIEAIVAATWKTNEVAPPIATPHIGGPMQFWLAATRSLRPVLADLGARLGDSNLEDIVYPHFLSGPLDARQRLEFLRFHIQRHARQIARIRAARAFPSDGTASG
jgi:DinB superfamily